MQTMPTGTFRLKGPSLLKMAGKNPHQIHLAGGMSYPAAIRYTDADQSADMKKIDLAVLYGLLVNAAGLRGRALSELRFIDVFEPVEGEAK